ncbi:MAG: PaaI family thioesterase [Bacteroidaceae bacterium]|nr:PaaI family thioesterase [Bacteroidaceae bacterium]
MDKDFFKNDRFATRAGMEVVELREGYARTRMLVSDDHLNAGGTVQGGAIFTLADLAFAAAVNSHDVFTVSTSSNITFFRPVTSGYIYAEAVEIVNHHRLPFAEVRVTDDEGQLIALFTSSGYRKK